MFRLSEQGNSFLILDNDTLAEVSSHSKGDTEPYFYEDKVFFKGIRSVFSGKSQEDSTYSYTQLLKSDGSPFSSGVSEIKEYIRVTLNVGFSLPPAGGFNPSTDLGVERIFESQSVNEQNPTGTGVAGAIQVEFGGPITTPYVSLDALGTLTFHIAGTYRIKNSFQFGREGTNAGTVKALFGIFTPSGTQLGRSLYQEIRDTNVDYYLEVDTILEAPDGLQLKGMLMRDADGVDQGGLIPFQPTVDGGNEWNAAPSAFIRLERYIKKNN